MDSFDFSYWNPLNHQSCVGDANTYQSTFDLNRPDLNYYITVTGNQVLGIDDLDQSQIKLLPNPVGNKLFIDIPEHVEIEAVRVYDINGRMVEKGPDVQTLDISALPSGLYFLNLMTAENSISKKFIKR